MPNLAHSGQPSRRHIYCDVSCWKAAGGRFLDDVDDIDKRQCIYCHKSFEPNTRLHRYCDNKCFEAAGESILQSFLMMYRDDVGPAIATKENCRVACLTQGFSNSMFDWCWAEFTYASTDDRLRFEDLPC
jgi:hypothetical protein